MQFVLRKKRMGLDYRKGVKLDFTVFFVSSTVVALDQVVRLAVKTRESVHRGSRLFGSN